MFKDYDNSIISSQTYHYDEAIILPSNPVRESDNTYNYTFKDWDKVVLTLCKGSAEYIAQYNQTYIEYLVLFKDYDNNFHNITLEELEKIQLEIIKNGQNLYKQKWTFQNDISTMTEESKVIAYNISYKNMDFTK